MVDQRQTGEFTLKGQGLEFLRSKIEFWWDWFFKEPRTIDWKWIQAKKYKINPVHGTWNKYAKLGSAVIGSFFTIRA